MNSYAHQNGCINHHKIEFTALAKVYRLRVDESK